MANSLVSSLGFAHVFLLFLLVFSYSSCLNANVTSSEQPASITPFQIACPCHLYHHPATDFIAIIISWKGIVHILVFLSTICLLHWTVSMMRAETSTFQVWIYNTCWCLAQSRTLKVCWVNNWMRDLFRRHCAVTLSKGLMCLVCSTLFAFVPNTFPELFWLYLETEMLPCDSKTRNITFWVEETSQIMPTAFSLLAANKSTIIKMLSKWFEIFLTLSKFHISWVDYPGQRIYHLLECLSSRKLKDIYKQCLINPYVKTCSENGRKTTLSCTVSQWRSCLRCKEAAEKVWLLMCQLRPGTRGLLLGFSGNISPWWRS